MLAAMTLLHHFTWFHCNNKAEYNVRHWCKNNSLIKETQSTRTWDKTADSLKPEADLLKAMARKSRRMRMAMQRYPENRWVRGHQEDTVPFELLPLEAQLNVEANQLATAAILGTLKKDTVLQVIKNPYCYAYLLQDGMIITRNEKEILQTKWRGALMHKYLKKWHNHKEPAMKDRMTGNEETYSTKQLTGWLPSGTCKEMYGDQVTACHRCGGIETNDHIIQCPRQEWITSSHWQISRNYWTT
jgi:hypothetical protein